MLLVHVTERGKGKRDKNETGLDALVFCLFFYMLFLFLFSYKQLECCKKEMFNIRWSQKIQFNNEALQKGNV